ncbi:asparagine synthase (glutamine-hydrolyzing) [Planctomycetes bacterium TBK1r]|uniref:asparagine synthase (glutamine-hydrolyzing) n=1 Tax=Stieleria magnilauensis TaxID=2527963 RepID=A0ABX5XND8_9BACT|nr:Asparagine synthetase [glutamine-hydrolyzing] 1 [Planctomycetes bacterium TBK1r]
MCGIAGVIWSALGESIGEEAFDRMTDALAHRGPDGRGTFFKQYADGSGAALGHRRLSIIDLVGGKQPMCNEDESVWVSFNGEIYNYQELRPALQSQGHQFRTSSDTETIVHLYEQYGLEFVRKLRGMFAIAIWDERLRRLILVRDRLGQKPLVYHCDANRLLFASEIKALLAIENVPREIREQGIDEYLTYGYIPHPRTIYHKIHKLPPAHMAVFERGQLSLHCYWNPALLPNESASLSDLQDQLRDVVTESVKLRMRSDVPLGAFLSGGIDSTVITGVMQSLAVTPTNTFTIGFPVDSFDESGFAQTAAGHLKTNHHLMEVETDSVSLLDKLAWLFDEPFADSSAIPTYYVAQLTRQHVKVALTGDGGDELFAGYDRYQTVDRLSMFDRLPCAVRRMMTGPLKHMLPDGPEASLRHRLRHRLEVLRQPLRQRYASWVSGFHGVHRDALYHKEMRESVDQFDTLDFIECILDSTEGLAHGVRAMRTDLHSYLPCDLLAKVDITSMANGIECRSPFLDHHVVECAGQFRFKDLSRRNSVKPVLANTFQSMIPREIRDRPKMGFRVPLDRWFSGDLQSYAYDTLLSHDAFCHRYFQPSAIDSLLDQHARGHAQHGDRIWSLLFLESWGRQQQQGSEVGSRSPCFSG